MSLAESIRQRLLNLAHKKAEPFDLTLTRYGLERLLYRISQSQWKSNFLLKGAMLFSLENRGRCVKTSKQAEEVLAR